MILNNESLYEFVLLCVVCCLVCLFGTLPAHFDDVTDDTSRLMKVNLVRILQELPKSPTRNIKTNYEKYGTLNEYSTNLRSMTRCDKSIARSLNIQKFLHCREQVASSIVKVGG